MAPWASHQDAAIGSAPLWSAANAGAVLRESGLLLRSVSESSLAGATAWLVPYVTEVVRGSPQI